MNRKNIVKKAIEMIESGKINDRYFSQDLVVEGIRPMPINKEQYVEYLEKMKESFPDISYNCKEIIIDNSDTAIAKVKISGTNSEPLNIPDIPAHPATGRKFVLPAEKIEYKFEFNRISRIKVDQNRTNEIINSLGLNPF